MKPLRVSPTVKETCKCGATFEFTGPNARWAVDEFRRNHAICRQNVWPWRVPLCGDEQKDKP